MSRYDEHCKQEAAQQQMAELLHITQATYSRYERGNLDVPSAVLITLANYHP
jgi:transcriptional regulator with XRE-family HTH domain